MKSTLTKLFVLALMILSITSSSVLSASAAASTPTIYYKSHCQNIGWMDPVSNGYTSGTVGRALQLEAVQAAVSGMSGSVKYRIHSQDIGWGPWVQDGMTAGTEGRALRAEAIELYLTGLIAQHYDIVYRAHCMDIGWGPWVKNGTTAGTTGQARRMEAVEIKLVPKNSNPSNGFDPIWPCESTYTVTALYKYSSGAAHSCRFKYGIDIGAPSGENVLAVESGKVIRSEYSTSSGFGNWIMIQHNNGKVSLYAHLSSRKVSVGDTVAKGQIIGKVGNTSAKYSLSPHLHFELGNGDYSGAAGDPYQEYYKGKYAGKLTLTQAAKKYNNP